MTSNINVADFLFGGKHLTGFWLSQWLPTLSQQKLHAIAEDMLCVFKDGKLMPYTGRSFPLEDVKSALEHATKHARGGKVFLKG